MINTVLESMSNSEFFTTMIGKDEQQPSINLNSDNLDFIIMMLHKRVSLESIKSKLGLTDSEFISKLNTLEKEGIIEKQDNNTYLPKCMGISFEDSEDIYRKSELFVDETVKLIVKNIDKIKNATLQMQCFKGFSFEELSLFILSDVLLDSVQIENVEQYFLNRERPLRNGKNYYLGIIEQRPGDSRECFGFYGNMVINFSEFDFCMYGNRRMNGENLLTLSNDKLKGYFSIDNSGSTLQVKKELLQELIKMHSDDSYKIGVNLEAGFNHINLMEDGNVKLIIMSEQEESDLFNIAEIIKDEYINIFERNKDMLVGIYNKSGYEEEISFEEYFIFWYHFYYAHVTYKLIDLGYIKQPQNDVFCYIVKK